LTLKSEFIKEIQYKEDQKSPIIHIKVWYSIEQDGGDDIHIVMSIDF